MFKKYFIIFQSPSNIYKKLCEAECKKHEHQVYLIKEVLNEIKKNIENVHENKRFKIEENEGITNIVERILYLNKLDQSGRGLKILTPNEMPS